MVANLAQDRIILTVAPKTAGRMRMSEFMGWAREVILALKELEASKFEEELQPSDWFIRGASIRASGEMSLELVPEFERSRRAANTYRIGLRTLDRGRRTPAAFTPAVLRHTRNAMKTVHSFSIKTSERREAGTTPKVARRVDELVRVAYTELTTIEGHLQQLAWHEKNPAFVIRHPVTNQKIRCLFSPKHREKAKAAWPHRVEVRGEMRYNQLGHPLFIKVSSFEQIPSEDQLPTLDDLKDVNITGGLSPVEYVRRLRVGE